MKTNMQIISILVLIKLIDLLIKDAFITVLPIISNALQLESISMNLLISLPKFGEGLGQLFWGDISDKFGRKLVLITAEIFIIAVSMIMLSSVTTIIIIICRLLQGLSMSGKIIGMHAIIGDLFSKNSTKISQYYAIIKIISLGFGIIVPFIALYMTQQYGWKSLLIILIIIKIIYLIFMIKFLPETLSKKNFVKFGDIKNEFKIFIKNPRYLLSILLGTMSYMWIYSYFNTIILYQNFLFFIPISHGINLAMASIGGLINIKMLNTISPYLAVFYAAIIMNIGAIGNAFIITMYGARDLYPLYGITIFCAIISFSITFITSNSMGIAANCYPKRLGVVLSIYGASQYIISSLFSIFISFLTKFFFVENIVAFTTCLIAVLMLITASKYLAYDKKINLLQ